MARIDFIRSLYMKDVPIDEFKFDNLCSYPLSYYLDPMAIFQLNKIATSVKYQSKPKQKYAMMDQILNPYGFRRITSGTNRAIYKQLDDQRIVLKVALDAVGIRDNPAEYYNQNFLKPFVTKCFDVSPCGTVGIFERVQPIMKKDEFLSISDDVFALINEMIGKYILDDIGTNFFMNYGLREGFGPVLLDFPYMYELDGRKLHCGNINPFTSEVCNGDIDYDDGFNNLICTKCGKIYLATELEKDRDSNNILIDDSPLEKGEIHKMKIEIVRETVNENGEIIYQENLSTNNITPETSHIVSKEEYERSFTTTIEKSNKATVRPNRTVKPSRFKDIRKPVVRASIVQPEPTEVKESEHVDLSSTEEYTKPKVSTNPTIDSAMRKRETDGIMRMRTPDIPDLNRYVPEQNYDAVPAVDIIDSTAVEITDTEEEASEPENDYIQEPEPVSENNTEVEDNPKVERDEDVSEDILDEY